MKHIIFLFLSLPVLAYSQGGTWPVKYNDSDPSGAPSASGTRLHFNTATNTLWFWEPAPSSTWRKQPKGFDQITGCAAPAYTPTARQSTFAVNSCSSLQGGPKLYQYIGAAWECLNCVDGLTLTAGAGITLSGTVPDITINANDASATNELNTSLSVTGGNLRLVDPGGNLDVAVSSIAPVQAVVAGTGISVSGTTTRTITNTAPDQTVAISAGTGIGVSGTYPNFTVSNSAPNVVQTLSIAGQDLTLSGGGGTVEIPGISWPLLAPDGDGGAPSYAFENSPESGLFYDNTLHLISASQGAANARNIEIKGGEGTSQNGGSINIICGNSSGRGGGGIQMQAGNSVGRTGGSFQLVAGASDGDNGGPMVFSGGYGIAGGDLIFSSGNGSSSGGKINFVPGISETDQAFDGRSFFSGNGIVVPNLTVSQRDNIDSPEPGLTIFSTDATTPDGTTGVMQTYNGTVWKNLYGNGTAFNANYTATGTATTAFTVSLPSTQPDATYSVSIMPKNALSATGWYISARTTTTFTVTYLTALTGAVDFDYIIVN